MRSVKFTCKPCSIEEVTEAINKLHNFQKGDSVYFKEGKNISVFSDSYKEFTGTLYANTDNPSSLNSKNVNFVEWNSKLSAEAGVPIALLEGEFYRAGTYRHKMFGVMSASIKDKPVSKVGEVSLDKETIQTLLEIIGDYHDFKFYVQSIEGELVMLQVFRVGETTFKSFSLEKATVLSEQIKHFNESIHISSRKNWPDNGVSKHSESYNIKNLVKKFGKGIDLAKEFEQRRGVTLSRGLGVL